MWGMWGVGSFKFTHGAKNEKKQMHQCIFAFVYIRGSLHGINLPIIPAWYTIKYTYIISIIILYIFIILYIYILCLEYTFMHIIVQWYKARRTLLFGFTDSPHGRNMMIQSKRLHSWIHDETNCDRCDRWNSGDTCK